MAHRVVSDADAPPLDPGDLTLDALLHPLGKDAFLESHFRRRAVVVTGGGAARAAALFPRRRPATSRPGAASSSERLMLWASLVDALLGETSLGLPPRRGAGQLAGHGEVEMFCARKSHVTGWHYDFQENFTVQLRGSKRWRVARSTESHPLRAHSLHFADASVAEDQRKAAGLCHGRDRGAAPSSKKRRRDADDVDEFVLEAGDVLYFPAGLYHEVESLDDDNVSLNVSLVAPSWAEVVTSSLRHCLSSREAFRARATSGPGAADDLRRLLGELKQIVGQLDVDKFTGAILPRACKRNPVIRSDGVRTPYDDSDGDDDSDDDGEFVIDVVNDPEPGGMRPCKLDVNPLAAAMQRDRGRRPSWVIINGNYGGSELLEPACAAPAWPQPYRKFEAALRAAAIHTVADAQNWEQRVKSELEASKQWYKDWGSLYAPSQPTNYQDRIEKLQAKADEIPGVRLQTNNSIYGTAATAGVKKPDLTRALARSSAVARPDDGAADGDVARRRAAAEVAARVGAEHAADAPARRRATDAVAADDAPPTRATAEDRVAEPSDRAAHVGARVAAGDGAGDRRGVGARDGAGPHDAANSTSTSASATVPPSQ
ncbi:hypothetical protein JL721_9995 [Aureococcus anophagefferens]|nr:hypothetical protein JL721_9995 [Aureococcus anophagefferens]